MSNPPYFIALLEQNKIIAKAIKRSILTEEDLTGQSFDIRHNRVIIWNFELDSSQKFASVEIFNSRFATLIDFISSDRKYFDDIAVFFNVHPRIHTFMPCGLDPGKVSPIKSKRIKEFELFGKKGQCTVLQSERFDCKIMFSFC